MLTYDDAYSQVEPLPLRPSMYQVTVVTGPHRSWRNVGPGAKQKITVTVDALNSLIVQHNATLADPSEPARNHGLLIVDIVPVYQD